MYTTILRYIYIYTLMAPGMGYIFAVSGYKYGPFRADMSGPGVASPYACICSFSGVSWFWQFSEPFSQIVVRWFGISAKSMFLTIVRLRKAEANFGNFSLKSGIFYFLGRSCPRNAQKNNVVFLLLSISIVSALGVQLPQVGVMKTVCCGGFEIAWTCDIYFWGRERF